MKRSDVTVKVPQVVGKLCKLMKELIDEFGKVGDDVIGNKRFCNIWYLSWLDCIERKGDVGHGEYCCNPWEVAS